jgi:hypothetical protein
MLDARTLGQERVCLVITALWFLLGPGWIAQRVYFGSVSKSRCRTDFVSFQRSGARKRYLVSVMPCQIVHLYDRIAEGIRYSQSLADWEPSNPGRFAFYVRKDIAAQLRSTDFSQIRVIGAEPTRQAD